MWLVTTIQKFKCWHQKKETTERGGIELTGQGCRDYEAILETRGKTWRDFFHRCKAFGDMSYRRVDYCLDDKIGLFQYRN